MMDQSNQRGEESQPTGDSQNSAAAAGSESPEEGAAAEEAAADAVVGDGEDPNEGH